MNKETRAVIEKMKGKNADLFKDVLSSVSLIWPLESGDCVQAVRGRGLEG